MASRSSSRRHAKATESDASPTSRSIDSASLVFGLVAIPVRVYSTSEPSHEVHFHMIHAGCGERLAQQYVCPKHGVVERADIAKGYAPDKGSMIELDKDELAALQAVGSGEIALAEFVPAAAVDPIYIDRTYYLGPDRGGAKAYRLLREALLDADLVGLATYAARGKAYLVMVRPFETGLALHPLRYPDEIKPWSVVGLHAADKPSADELALAKKLVAHLEHAKFDPAKYTDTVKARVRQLLERKVKHGEAIATEAAPKPSAVPDLMAALKASLGVAPAHEPAAHATKAAAKPAAKPHARAHAPRNRAPRTKAAHAKPHATARAAHRAHR